MNRYKPEDLISGTHNSNSSKYDISLYQILIYVPYYWYSLNGLKLIRLEVFGSR